MQVALFNIMALNHRGETPASVMATTKQAVAQADRLGFDVAWFAEHHFSAFSICASPQMMAMHCAGFTKPYEARPGCAGAAAARAAAHDRGTRHARSRHRRPHGGGHRHRPP